MNYGHINKNNCSSSKMKTRKFPKSKIITDFHWILLSECNIYCGEKHTHTLPVYKHSYWIPWESLSLAFTVMGFLFLFFVFPDFYMYTELEQRQDVQENATTEQLFYWLFMFIQTFCFLTLIFISWKAGEKAVLGSKQRAHFILMSLD